MTFAGVGDELHKDPRRFGAGLEAIGLLAVARTWISDLMTDGVIPMDAALGFAGGKRALCQKLVDAGYWKRVPMGYQDVEYFRFNKPRQEVLERKAIRAEAGRIGGQRSADVRREKGGSAQPPAKDPQRAIGTTLEALAQPNAEASASGTSKQISKHLLKQGAQATPEANPEPPYPVPRTPQVLEPIPLGLSPARGGDGSAAHAAVERERVLAWCREHDVPDDAATFRAAQRLCVLDGWSAAAVIAVAGDALSSGAKRPLSYFRDMTKRLHAATPISDDTRARLAPLVEHFSAGTKEASHG